MGADAAVDDADVGVSATAALCQRCRGGGRDGRGTASHMNVVGREVAAGRDILEPLHRLFERKAARRGERHGAEAELLKVVFPNDREARSEEHTSELQSLMRISYAVFCLKKKNNTNQL